MNLTKEHRETVQIFEKGGNSFSTYKRNTSVTRLTSRAGSAALTPPFQRVLSIVCKTNTAGSLNVEGA